MKENIPNEEEACCRKRKTKNQSDYYSCLLNNDLIFISLKIMHKIIIELMLIW
jgi:hypothetical protein